MDALPGMPLGVRPARCVRSVSRRPWRNRRGEFLVPCDNFDWERIVPDATHRKVHVLRGERICWSADLCNRQHAYLANNDHLIDFWPHLPPSGNKPFWVYCIWFEDGRFYVGERAQNWAARERLHRKTWPLKPLFSAGLRFEVKNLIKVFSHQDVLMWEKHFIDLLDAEETRGKGGLNQTGREETGQGMLV